MSASSSAHQLQAGIVHACTQTKQHTRAQTEPGYRAHLLKRELAARAAHTAAAECLLLAGRQRAAGWPHARRTSCSVSSWEGATTAELGDNRGHQAASARLCAAQLCAQAGLRQARAHQARGPSPKPSQAYWGRLAASGVPSIQRSGMYSCTACVLHQLRAAL